MCVWVREFRKQNFVPNLCFNNMSLICIDCVIYGTNERHTVYIYHINILETLAYKFPMAKKSIQPAGDNQKMYILFYASRQQQQLKAFCCREIIHLEFFTCTIDLIEARKYPCSMYCCFITKCWALLSVWK